jgi:hypothetical protein
MTRPIIAIKAVVVSERRDRVSMQANGGETAGPT